MYLIDTNIFLEILLEQEKSNICKDFLNSNLGNIVISDFSLHSIGVILFRNQKHQVFQEFILEIFPRTSIYSLPSEMYESIHEYATKNGLDFDDTYQSLITKYYELTIVTMDNDFKKASDVKVEFL